MLVRDGVIEDVESCIDMSEKFYQTTAYIDHIPLDRDSCRAYFELSIEQGLLSVAENNGELIGMLLVIKGPFPMNQDYFVGAELAWWIEPAYRKGFLGKRLLDFAEKKSKKAGITFSSMMSMQASMPEKVKKLYELSGYKHEESTFLKVL